jgi:hypothetical protein
LHRCVHVSEARYSTFPETPVNPLNCFQDNDLRFFCGSSSSPRKSCGSVNKSRRIKRAPTRRALLRLYIEAEISRRRSRRPAPCL